MWLAKLDAEPEKLRFVVNHMRDADRREIFATRLSEDPDDLVRDVLSIGPVQWLVGLDRPIAALGAGFMWDGVYSMWLFATDELHTIGKSVTKLARDRIIPMLFATGAHRLECRSMEGHHDAQRWLEVIGARREGSLRAYGKAGEDFHVYTWETR